MADELAGSLAEGLHAAGIRKIFGMPGGGPNLDMIGLAEERGIDFVLAHTEAAACVMAASFGRLTGTPGAAIVTRGPGFTSASNGLAQATLDRFPLLLVSDCVSSATASRTAHQRLDQVAAARPLTKWSGTLGTADPVGVVQTACRLALAAPAGAVHLAFDPTTPGDRPPEDAPGPRAEEELLARAREAIGSARRPLVVLGLDAVRHSGQVRECLAELDCPVLVTYEAKGVIPESWSTYAGMFTGAVLERPLLERADLIIGLGLDPVEPMPGQWLYAAPVLLLHGHRIETGYFGDPLHVVGSYDADLLPLVAGCRPQWQHGAGAEARSLDLARLEVQTRGLNPQDVVRTTQACVGDVLATVDAGAHMLVTMPLWHTDEASSVLISNGLATMGFALPAAIGMALAHPGRRVTCLVGDGGLSMVQAELETLARLALDVTVVVFNDATLTLIKLKQQPGRSGHGAVSFGNVDYAGVAVAMGVDAEVVRDVAELKAALGRGRPGPLLVDARIDQGAYPHVIRTIRG